MFESIVQYEVTSDQLFMLIFCTGCAICFGLGMISGGQR